MRKYAVSRIGHRNHQLSPATVSNQSYDRWDFWFVQGDVFFAKSAAVHLHLRVIALTLQCAKGLKQRFCNRRALAKDEPNKALLHSRFGSKSLRALAGGLTIYMRSEMASMGFLMILRFKPSLTWFAFRMFVTSCGHLPWRTQRAGTGPAKTSRQTSGDGPKRGAGDNQPAQCEFLIQCGWCLSLLIGLLDCEGKGLLSPSVS